MKKFIIKATTLAGVGTLLVTGALPVNAEDTTSDGTTKDESVYVVLNADGSVSNVTVSDQIHNANGFSNYQDKSDLKDVQNLKSDDPVQSSSDGYKWTTTDTDIYYQGKTTKALPLDTTIEYKLDGKTVDPKDIVGKSGHLSMTFNIKNTQTKQYTIDGKTYTVCQPFYVAAGGMLDQDHFTNVKIDHGTVSTDTSHSIALAVMMPGMKDSIGQFLTGDLSSLNDYLFDTITIEADVTDFESPTMMMAASTDLSALKGELKDDGAFDTTDLFDQLDKLDDATKQLIDGASALYDGADQLASGAKDLDTGAGTLNDGAQSLLDGIASLNNGTASLVSGASQVNDGASALASGLNTLNSNSADLNDAAQKIADGVLGTVNSSLAQQGLGPVNWVDYPEKFKEYLKISDTMCAQAFARVKSEINAAAPSALDDVTISLALYRGFNKYNSLSDDEKKNTTFTQYFNDNITSILTEMLSASNVQANMAKYSQDGYISDAKTSDVWVAYPIKIVEKLTGITDDAQATTLLTYAMLFDKDDTQSSDPYTMITNAVQKAAVEIAQGQASTDTTAKAVFQKKYDAAKDSNSQKQVKSTIADAIYDSAVSTIESNGKDETTAKVVLTYAINEYLATENDITKAITDVVSDSAKALDVKNDQDSLKNNTNGAKQTVESAEISLVQESSDYQKSEKDLDGARTSLDGIKAFLKGLKSYTAGVASAASGANSLASGTEQLESGTEQLQSGASQLQTGAQSLKNGTQSLKDGTSKLSSGADSLKDGAGKLKDGLQQYNDEGISKLTENSDLDNLQTASKLISDIQDDDDAYVNYSGISDGTDGTVKFIYKISTVKSEADTEKDAASKSDDTSDVQESSDKGNFFTRLADLFIFWN